MAPQIYQIYTDHVQIVLPSAEAIFTRPLRLLAKNVDAESPTDSASNKDEECLWLFINPSHRPSASSPTAATRAPAPKPSSSPSSPKKAKRETVASSAKGKGRQTDEMPVN